MKNTVVEMYWLMLYGKLGVKFYINVKSDGSFKKMTIEIPNTGMLRNKTQYHEVKESNYLLVFRIFQTAFIKDHYRGTQLVSKSYNVDTRKYDLKLTE
jgi:hypothetical protein